MNRARTSYGRKPGQFVGVGGQITTLTPLPRVWVIANYKETQLTHIDDADGLTDQLRPGLSVIARVNTRRRNAS